LRLSNLPYGDHQLLIKAQAADGQWSANTLAIKLMVVRPVYMRSWFLTGMVLLTGAGIWSWLRWRIWRHKMDKIHLEQEVRQATIRIEQDKEIIERQAHALLRLNKTRSQFFANISHEFRTPLTVILGMAAELRGYKPETQLVLFEKAAGLIERNGTNLLRLINQILDLSKLEAGEMHLHPVQADLVVFARYIGESFHSMAKTRNIGLHFISQEETIEADFDKDKLGDILSNLLSNALKFTPQGGHIYYQLKLGDGWQALSPQGYYEELTPTSHPDGQWIHLSVSDTGPGIEPSSLANIFARFYQAGNQQLSNVGGTGIGLSLVRELVLLMQGGLAVRNLPDQGAEFVVSLPLTRKALPAGVLLPAPTLVSPERSEETGPGPVASGNRPLLLLVEDNADVAQYTKTCIGEEYGIIQAADGLAGFKLALEKMPDIILSDVMMPLMDGFELCDKLKNDERTSHIPIILLTARAAASDRITGLRRGADAYLTKPFGREELLIVLSNLIKSRRLLQIHYSQLALGALQGNPLPMPAGQDEALEDQFLVKLRTTVEARLDNAELSADMISQLMGMSRNTLHRKMNALTGMSINPYVRTLRLQKAKELLLTPDLSIAEVAYAVGFEDPKYFSRIFSEEHGISPSTFRNLNKK
jgi:signal transduction histidine kinase/DNA-binding response OmpR family regulator